MYSHIYEMILLKIYIYFFTHPILKNEYFHIIILNAEMHKLNSVWSLGEDIYLKIY